MVLITTKEVSMNRIFSITLLALLLFASNALAGFSSYSDISSSDSVIAPIQIKNKGIYNLVVSIHFLNAPTEDKVYKSDPYDKFMRRLKVEWSGVAIIQILKAKEQGINDLANLKANIEGEITKLANQLKSKYAVDKNVEVVFSISNFFILEPKDK
jgi:outer membrane protease